MFQEQRFHGTANGPVQMTFHWSRFSQERLYFSIVIFIGIGISVSMPTG